MTFDGMLDDDAKKALGEADAFSVTELQSTPDNDIGKILQAVQVPGVDPNLYETNQFMTDIQLTVGAQEAQFGAVAKATATESSIAEGSRIASVDSNVDDLDAFLTRVARASGQVLLRELSIDTVEVPGTPDQVDLDVAAVRATFDRRCVDAWLPALAHSLVCSGA